MAATCEDCGQPAELVIVTFSEQEGEALCWADLLKRCLAIAADATIGDDDDGADSVVEPGATR